MAIISRPFDKDRVENRELAALANSTIGSDIADLIIIRSLVNNNNEPLSYEEGYRIAITAYARENMAGSLMRLAHYGVLDVVDFGNSDYKYQLSPGFLELVQEIKTAINS